MKIVLDPGHGGVDVGAVGKNGLYEKTANWMIATKTKALLDKIPGVECIIVQPSTANPKSTSRDEVYKVIEEAKRINPDLYISIHQNAGGGKGFESFVHTLDKDTGADYIRSIIHKQMMAFLKKYNIVDRGKKTANFAVLRGTRVYMTSMLFECVFIDNPREEALLKDEKFIDGLANELAYAIKIAYGIK